MGPLSVSLSSRKDKASLATALHLGSNCWAICWNIEEGVCSSIQLMKMDLNFPENWMTKNYLKILVQDWPMISFFSMTIHLHSYNLIGCVLHMQFSLFLAFQICTYFQVYSFQWEASWNSQWQPTLCLCKKYC